ncbi:signal recognition particle-docking protein FtsY [Candidatus Woesearchaeota archaeon]|nr:signal recognition particle-docking protein FtsY [Candidatus Woesearchaeota archaeon]
MFGFLKDKIKSAISKISRKVEEEAPKEEIETKKVKEENPKQEKKKVEKIKKREKIKSKSLEDEHKSEELTPEKEIIEEPEKINGLKITYFVHGTTTDNEKEISTGQAQGELSELGKKQAIELREKINLNDFDIIFSSDLKRAVDSANLTFKNFKIIQDKRLRECDYGDLNQSGEENIFYVDHINRNFPYGESLKDVEKRIAEFLNYLFENYYGKHAAIIAHKAPQLAIEVLLNNKSWEEAIEEDWRLKKAWQPGWNYFISNKVELKEEKKGFFSKLKEKFVRKEEEIKPIEEKKEIIEEAPKEEFIEEKKGIFGLIKEKITTTKISEEKFGELFYELELALLENNVAFEVVEKIKEDMKNNIIEKPIKRGNVEDEIKNSLKSSIEDLFNVEKINLLEKVKTKKPYIICFVGINGSGKTTSIAKIAHLLQKNKKSVVLAAADTFRAAAIQQLKEWGSKLNLKVIAHDYGSDPAAVTFDTIKYAEAHGIDVVLIDTAGRLHSNKDLVREMQKIIRVAKPDMKIFVGESITGNDCIEQAKEFNSAIDIDGIILSKADVDEKGGAMVSTAFVTKKPIIYIGTGQNLDDLKEFDKEEIIKNLGL